MPKDTIVGDVPSGTPPRESGIGTGNGSAEAFAPDSERSSDGTLDSRIDWSSTGDVTTAFHLSRLYSLVSLGFERPGREFQRAVNAGGFDADLIESAEAISQDITAIARAVADSVEDPEVLYEEWASLFGVEEGRTVSLYELTYLPGPLMTNVRKLADISGFYAAFDLEVNSGWNDRSDHLCFLLEFLSNLSMREAHLRLEGDERGVAIVGDARSRFIEDHLGRWYWRFAGEVSNRNDGFYATLGELMAALVEDEIERYELEPAWVPDDPTVTEWTEGIFGDSGSGCGGCGVTPQEHIGGTPGFEGPGETGNTSTRDR